MIAKYGLALNGEMMPTGRLHSATMQKLEKKKRESRTVARSTFWGPGIQKCLPTLPRRPGPGFRSAVCIRKVRKNIGEHNS